MEEEGPCAGCSRRTFLKTLGLAASSALCPGLSWAEGPMEAVQKPGDAAAGRTEAAIPLDKLPGLDKPGCGLHIKLQGRDVLLIRVSESEIVALDPACRHKKCGVKFETGWDKIKCKCHGSRYDLHGRVLNGPATKDLAAFPAEISGGTLRIGLP